MSEQTQDGLARAPLGLTLPTGTAGLSAQPRLLAAARDAGFTDLWSGEVNGVDAFSPLVAAAATVPAFRLGTAIVSAYTRSPAVIAMSAAALSEMSGERVAIGIGASSNVIVENWNGIPYERPVQRVRDVVTFLRRAFNGDRVTMRAESFDIDGFRLGVHIMRPPRILVAALRPAMLRLAGTAADGAILNWLSPSDVRKVVPYVTESCTDAPEIVARLFVMVEPDREQALLHAKRMIAAYLTVPAYVFQQRFLGRGARLEELWRRWTAGDRAGAIRSIPDSVVDDLFVLGTPEACRHRIAEYVAAGVTTPVVHFVGIGDGDPSTLLRSIGPVRSLAETAANRLLSGCQRVPGEVL